MAGAARPATRGRARPKPPPLEKIGTAHMAKSQYGGRRLEAFKCTEPDCDFDTGGQYYGEDARSSIRRHARTKHLYNYYENIIEEEPDAIEFDVNAFLVGS